MNTKVMLAFVVATMVAGAGTGSGVSARAEEPGAARLLRNYRCMMITEDPSRGGSGPPSVLATPRVDAPQLGPASEPTIVDDPLRVVNGYARVLLLDGRPGWVRRNRLRNWTVAASPALRCYVERMPDGRLEFGYIHPG